MERKGGLPTDMCYKSRMHTLHNFLTLNELLSIFKINTQICVSKLCYSLVHEFLLDLEMQLEYGRFWS